MIQLRRLGSKGVTFVEILLVMGLLSIFLVVMTTIFTSALDVQTQSETYSATLSDGRFIMARLNYDISRATAVTTPAALGAAGTSLVLTINATPYTFAVVGSNLQLTDPTGSANLTGGTSISSVSFQRLGNVGGKDTVRYTFILSSLARNEGVSNTQTFTSTAELR
ncbi:hypothetical protein H7097_03585 [Aeromicrobium sp.]|nr:hypothetical protein [Candidatus Saccharibacteria bacterium]